MFQDVDKDIAWARIALDRKPEAINLWIGNSRSTTALHKDNYENIYCQVTGMKHFALLPPVEVACINERRLRAARYQVPVHNESCRWILSNSMVQSAEHMICLDSLLPRTTSPVGLSSCPIRKKKRPSLLPLGIQINLESIPQRSLT